MKKNIFAVCDLEVEYALNFMDYLNQKKNIPFEIQAFTTVENLITYGKHTHIELLLISGRAMCKEIRELDIGKVIILSEGVHPPELDQYPSVYKYQSSSDVLREVMACYGAEKKTMSDQLAVLKKTTEILGVFSPLGRCLKTSFALTLGQILAKDKAVLYLNLEEYSGFTRLINSEYKADLSDVLYLYRQGGYNWMKLKSMISNWGNMDFIPPVRYAEDLSQVAPEDMAQLIDRIARESGYDRLVVDVGQMGRGALPVLSMCNVVYMPVREDYISAAKIEEFEEYLEEADDAGVRDRIQKLRLPRHTGIAKQEGYLEQLIWGEMGDYVRQLLNGKQPE